MEIEQITPLARWEPVRSVPGLYACMDCGYLSYGYAHPERCMVCFLKAAIEKHLELMQTMVNSMKGLVR